MYGCESWTIKKAEHRRIDAFELWCWRRLFRVSWTARRSNQSILKEINPEYSLCYWSWSSNTLATWCEDPTHWKRPWCWKRLRARGEGGNRGWDGGWYHQLNGHEQTLADKWRTGNPGMLQTIGSQRVGHDWANEQEPQHRTLILEESQRPAISEGMKKILWFLWLKTEFSLTFQVIMYD